MSALAADMHLDFWTNQELELARRPALAAIVRDEPVGGERTLEDLILGAWEELAAQQPVGCLVCGGTLNPEYERAVAGGPGRLISATCVDCGSQLS